MARQVYRHTETGRLYVERNVKKGAFYEVNDEDGELVHLAKRRFVEADVTSENLVPVEIKQTGIEEYV